MGDVGKTAAHIAGRYQWGAHYDGRRLFHYGGGNDCRYVYGFPEFNGQLSGTGECAGGAGLYLADYGNADAAS